MALFVIFVCRINAYENFTSVISGFIAITCVVFMYKKTAGSQ
jgi:hypothetical protein